MRIWRVSNHRDLSGEGGRKAAGRWHHKGQLVVYCSEHPALALLEVMAHLEIDREDLPSDYQLLEIELPDTVAVAKLTEAELLKLSREWSRDAHITRTHLAPWFERKPTAVIAVPSVVTPSSTNFLINPLHADASKLVIIRGERYPYDRRLFAAKAVHKT